MFVELGFGERHGSPAEPAFGADPPYEPLRTAAARAVVMDVGTIDDVVTALCKVRRKIGRCPLKYEDVRQSLRLHRRGPSVLMQTLWRPEF